MTTASTIHRIMLGTFAAIVLASSLPVKADDKGRLLGVGVGAVIKDADTGKYLLVPNLPVIPIDTSLSKSTAIVMDSGIAKDHPQLGGRVIEEVDFTGEGTADELGHGTVVALLLHQAFMSHRQIFPKDMWYEISYVSLKVVSREGGISKQAVLKALAWIEKNDAESANLSLGFKGTLAEHADLCEAVTDKRTRFAVAAGNEGPNVPFFPASCPSLNVVSVGCIGEDGKTAPYSGKAQWYAPCSIRLRSSAQLLIEEGNAYGDAGDLDTALAKYEESLQDKPLPVAHFLKGLVLSRKNLIAAAGDAFRAALNLTRDFPEALEQLAILYAEQGDLPKAKSLLQEAIDIPPPQPSIHFNLALVLTDLNEFDAALAELDIVANLSPQHPKLAGLRDEILRRKNPR
jgi:tetratricopeptide (TPR) repeat protein